MKDCWKHWLKSYLACMNDCSDPKRNDNLFDSTKVFMPYFDQVYVKTCFGQVWKIVKCKLLEVFLLVTCKSVGLNWRIEKSHVLLLFYLSCKLKRVLKTGQWWELCKLPLRYKINQVWTEGTDVIIWRNVKTIILIISKCNFLENCFACDRFAIQNI